MPEFVPRSINLEKIHVRADRLLSRAELQDARATQQEIVGGILFSLTGYVVGVLKERISIHEKIPRDWWQAVRERWCPHWWLSRYPVKYRIIDVERDVYARVCPHVQVRNDHSCFRWLAAGE